MSGPAALAELLPVAGAESSAAGAATVEAAVSAMPEELPPIACLWITPPLVVVLVTELPLAAGAADRASGMARPAAEAVRLGAAAGEGAGAAAR